MFATKVNFYMRNHHVGLSRTEASGYVEKVLKSLGLGDASGAVEATWRLGHYMDTRRALCTMGFTGLVNNTLPFAHLAINLTDDFKLRVASNPAGTAKIFTYLAIAKRAASSVYGSCIPILATLPGVIALSREIN